MTSTTDLAPRQYATKETRYAMGGLIVLLHVALGLNLFAPASLLTLVIDEMGISSTKAGLLIAGPVLIQAFVGLPGGTLVRRFGAHRTATIGSLLGGAGALSLVTTGFAPILIARLVMGAGAALVITATGPLIMDWFPPRETSTMNTMFLVALSSGISLGVLGSAPLATRFGWRETLGLFGVASLVAMAVWTIAGLLLGHGTSPVDQAVVHAPGRTIILEVLSDRTVRALIFADSMVFIQYSVLTTWLPAFFNESRGMSVERAGLLTGMLPGIGIAAVIVGGIISARAKSWRGVFVVCGLLVGISGFATFIITSHVGILIAVLALGIGTWAYQPTFHTAPMQLPWMTPEKVAVVWGSSMTFAGIGMFVAPLVVGASHDVLGSYVPGFILWAMLSWALLALGLRLPESISRPLRHDPHIDQ